MNLLTYVFAFAIFACVGSFIGVCADRIPRREQIWKGRSRCDSCGKTLSALELIPIVSFLFLRGRCRHCKAKIPFQSTAIELAAAVLGTLAIYLFGPTLQGIAYGIVTCILIEIAVLDYKTMEISDLASLLIAAIGATLTVNHGDYLSALIGLVCVSVPFLVLALFKTMGMGDVKLMAAVGLLLGYRGVLLAAFFGIVIGSVAAITMKLRKSHEWKSEIPFGPYLCVGTYLAMLFGERVISWYLSLL